MFVVKGLNIFKKFIGSNNISDIGVEFGGELV